MRVEGRVGRSDRRVGDGSSEEDREDGVLGSVVLVLVEGEEDQRAVVVERRVGEQRREEVVDPLPEEGVGGVVSVVHKVRGLSKRNDGASAR